jgi:hypothetical protein
LVAQVGEKECRDAKVDFWGAGFTRDANSELCKFILWIVI